MALSIRDPETDRLARELARLTGETMTQAIRTSLAERLARERRRREQDVEKRYDAIMEVLERIWAMPVLDGRSADEIIGYDEHGLPT
jgi:antitoxin VapB